MMQDENYYDDDGNKMCDNFGNRILVNDGTNIYDIERNHKPIYYPNRIEDKSICSKLQMYWNNPKLIYTQAKESLLTCSWRF